MLNAMPAGVAAGSSNNVQSYDSSKPGSGSIQQVYEMEEQPWNSDVLAEELESMNLAESSAYAPSSNVNASFNFAWSGHNSGSNSMGPDSGSLYTEAQGPNTYEAMPSDPYSLMAGSHANMLRISSTPENQASHHWASGSGTENLQAYSDAYVGGDPGGGEGYLEPPSRFAHAMHRTSSSSQRGRHMGPDHPDNMPSTSAFPGSDMNNAFRGMSSPRGRGGERQRGQGYRKLWQQVTKVNKGQKLNDNIGSVSDVTVEDLVRVVMKLAPLESAVSAVEPGLHYLDSSALAALLKELAKQGHLKRSVEIFDWLRGLSTAHELHRLCDLYTYTTMISQCGSHQQLRRALELVAEMRSKGITCNVHTYSALMNVCIKANELELAQDVFTQMIEEGCTPNLVTYNILIDVHVKNGQWEEAVARLDTLEQQGIQAEVRTYNTVISACNKCGQPEQALKIYDRMLAAGIKPSATTYTALISAYGKRGLVEKAMEVYQDMIRRGCERNVITYSSLISACEKAGRWEMAMDLFGKMHREGCRPNVVTYNSLIAACAHGNHWEKASELFEQMQKEGCQPDGITFAALITAYEKGGQWRRALQALEHMQSQGCHPDAAVFNSLMEVLWQSGVLMAQVRALQLWSLANKNGQFRIYINSRSSADSLQYSTLAFTCGAIYVTVLRWLAELKSKLAKDGPAFFRARVSLSLNKSKQASRGSEQVAAAQETLTAMLSGAGSPLVVQAIDNVLVVEASSPELINWLRTPDFGELVFLTQGASLKKMSLDTLFSEDVAVATRCMEAFSAVRRVEDAHVMNLAFYNPLVLQQRSQVVHLALKYGSTFGFKDDAIFDGLQLFDKVQCSGTQLNVNLWPLVLCVCVMLAGRHGDRSVPWPGYDQIALLTGFGADAIASMERTVLVALRQDLSCISVLRVMQLCLERLGYFLQGDYGHFKLNDRVAKDMHALLVKLACSPITIGVRPSIVASATLVVLRKLKGMVPFWPMSLQIMTMYALHPGSDLHTCMLHIESLL